MYSEVHLVADLGWVDIDLDCSATLLCQNCLVLICPSRIWLTGSGPAKNKFNPTQVYDQMPHLLTVLNYKQTWKSSTT